MTAERAARKNTTDGHPAADEAPRPAWDSGGDAVSAALRRFSAMGFDAQVASELVTSTARIVSEQLEDARSRHDVIAAMRSAVKIASIAYRTVREENGKKGLPVLQAACARGCTHCCSLHVSVSAPEALVLAAFLRDQLDATAFATLREQLARAAEEVRGLDQAARVTAKTKCPLLVGDACSVYPVRPLACAGASSVDASACEKALDDPNAGVPIEPIVHGAMRAVQLGLAVALSARGLDVGRYELAGAVAAAMADDAAARFLAGERVFERSAADVDESVIARGAEAFVTRDPHLPRRAVLR